MFCPKCKSRLRVTHSVSTQTQGSVQNCVCPNPKCKCVVVAVKVIAAIDPPPGKGFTSIANKMAVRDRQSKT